jgi:hypothetical protein
VEAAELGKTQSKQSCKTLGTIQFAKKKVGHHVTASMGSVSSLKENYCQN